MFIDTHTHLYDETLMPEMPTLLQRAMDADVQRMYMPNCNSETITGMMALASKYPQLCYPMMGLHPCYVKEDFENELQIVAEWLQKESFAAIGEIGLDYYWDTQFRQQQITAFEQQIDWALQYQLPIVIHSREATRDCIDIVRKKHQGGALKGVFHCFSGTVEEALEVAALGFYLGIGGVVTFKKSNLSEVISAVGLQQIVLETDAPYLAPIPFRGKRNESSYIPLIAQAIATHLATDMAAVKSITTTNALRLFNADKA